MAVKPSPRDLKAQQDAEKQSLAAKVDLLVQKMRTFEKNLEVVGRTLVAFKERLKEAKAGSGVGGGVDEAKLDEKYATKQDFLEVKYVMDSINPMEFARLDQVQEFVKEEVERQLKKKT